jgi:hypothetical protein
MKKTFSTFLLLALTISYINSQTIVKLALPDNCNKAITSTESIQPNDVFKIDIRPNPNKGSFELFVKTEKLINKASINILDFNGKTVYNKSFFCNSTNFIKHLEIPGLPSGIYLLLLKSETIKASAKIVIE